jgi:phosphoglycolate phosphatase
VRPAAILFDLDGTLADSFEGIWRALSRALRECALPAVPLPWVREHVGRGVHELVRDAAGEGAEEALVHRLGRLCMTYYEQGFVLESPPVPGARAVLLHVHARTNGKVAVVSNKLEALCRAWVTGWGLAGLVARVAGPDTFGVRKPHPGAVRPLLAELGVAPGDALLVGDMAVDAATGLAAGVPTVGVRQPWVPQASLRRAGMVAVLFDLRDLPGWLAGNGTGWRD